GGGIPLGRAAGALGASVFLGDRRQAVEIEEHDAAAHARPGVHLLRAPGEEARPPGLLPEVRRVAGRIAARTEQVSAAERTFPMEGVAHEANETKDISGKPGAGGGWQGRDYLPRRIRTSAAFSRAFLPHSVSGLAAASLSK